MKSLFDNFEILADAPDGIPKLRELILDLAVRGKLTEEWRKENPDVEPAKVLIEKIKREKEKLVKEGKIKKQEELPEIQAEEKVFDVPHGWEWVRLCELGAFSGGGTPSSNNSLYWNGNISWISPKDMKSPVILQSELAITEAGRKAANLELYKPGCILIVARSGILRRTLPVCINSIPCTVNQDIKVHSPFLKTISAYLQLMLNGHEQFILHNLVKTGVTVESLKYKEFEIQPFPFPSFQEQKAIIKIITQLMSLCDQLDQSKSSRHKKLISLNNSSLDRLLSPTEPTGFRYNWRRITDNFASLYSLPENVDKLKQAVLQLAVMGKLTENWRKENPNVEPAKVLIEKIKKEKEKLIKEGKIKKQEELPEITEEEKAYEVPYGWEWVRLAELTQIITKGSSPKWQGIQYTDSKNGVLFITSENVGNYSLRLENRKYVDRKFNEIEPRSILKKNDLLMNIVGASIGRTAIYDIDDLANINQAVCIIRLIDPGRWISLRFMLQFFNSPACIARMFDKQVDNARANLSMGNISEFPIPVPSINEQSAIVSQVTHLLSLCDSLASSLSSASAKSDHLFNAIMNRLGA
jgi:type I restriction enzyme, S subunit